MIQLCGSPQHAGRANPSDKVVKNLFTFLCQDTGINPIFKPNDYGILSLKEAAPKNPTKGEGEEETEEQITMRVMRRGAMLAFNEMALLFGSELMERVPKFWEGISGAFAAFEGEFCIRPGL